LPPATNVQTEIIMISILSVGIFVVHFLETTTLMCVTFHTS